MPVEIRILTGARAGQTQKFDQAVVVIGRHANTDLRFDPQQDLDVSGRHAEIRVADGQYVVHDASSTNGTFVNGKRIAPSRVLEKGDRVQFGAKGPEVEIHFDRVSTGSPIKPTPRSNTEQRIAIAVKEQTKGLKRFVIAAVVLAVVGGGGGFLYASRAADSQVEQLKQSLAASDSLRKILQMGSPQIGDTAFANEVQRKLTALQQRLPEAKTDAERNQIKSDIDKLQTQLIQLVRMDLPAIRTRNAPAVVLLISDIAGKNAAGTGFGITPEGLLVTNRHNVVSEDGKTKAQRIAIKFTDTPDWLPAHVVKVSDDPDSDLALVQVDREGPFPVVSGVSTGATDAIEGLQVVAIGYPSGYDTPMEGAGNDFIAKSTLGPGTISKKTSKVLQIDSYATHGSSGSPVFSTRGYVIGVIYGGASETGGKIVFAVTPEKLVEFLPTEAKALVKN